ncbi:hypothetical protein, partial [Clostridioides difficile]|uniref:hypothetical protein n=1 Tax=Clostridioides difficile TaxID=1496 RepID=UPI0029C3F491
VLGVNTDDLFQRDNSYKLSSFCNTKMFNTLDKKYFKYVSYKDSKELISNFKSVYRSVNE